MTNDRPFGGFDNELSKGTPAANLAGALTASPTQAQQELAQTIQNLLNQRDFEKADGLIRQMMARDPESPDAHYLTGVSAYFQGQIGKTIEHLRKALEIDPHHTDAAICLSVLFNDVGKYSDGRRVFEQANQSVAHHKSGDDTAIDQKFAVKHLELADLYFRYRRYDEAIDEYGKAALLDPTTLDIRIRRAKAYAKKGFLSRAIHELQQLKGQHSDYIPARIQLGLLHYSQGNVLDAELEWEQALKLDPSNREAFAYLEMAAGSRIQKRP